MMLRASYLLALAVSAALGFFSVDAFSADAVARAELKGSYARIMISGKEPVRFSSHSQGNTLILNFDSPTHVDFSSLGALKPYITGSAMSPDGKTATLTMKSPYGTRHFISGNASGLDVLGLASPALAVTDTTAEASPSSAPVPVKPVEKSITAHNSPMPWLNKPVSGKAPPIAAPVKPVDKTEAKAVQPPAPIAPPAKTLSQVAPSAIDSPQAAAKSSPLPPKSIEAKKEVAAPSFAALTKENASEGRTQPQEDTLERQMAKLEEKPAQTPASTEKEKPKKDTLAKTEKVINVTTPAAKEETKEDADKQAAEEAKKKIAEAKAEQEKRQLEEEKAAKEKEEAEAAKKAEEEKAAQLAKVEEEKRNAAVTARKKENEIPDAPLNPQTGGQAGDFIVTVDARKTAAEFYFPWKERVAAAAFIRGNNIFAVFNKGVKVDVGMLKTILPGFIESVEQLPSEGNTVLYMKSSTKLYARARKAPNSYNWILALSRRSGLPQFPVVAETKVEPPQKPSIFLPVLEAAKPMEFKDPSNGETLMVVPVYKDGVGVFPERSFVDATFLRTAQGVALVKKNNALRISRPLNGLRVSAPQGLMLSGDLPPVNLQDFISAEDNSLTLFPYNLWKVADQAAFNQRRQQIMKQITESADDKTSFHRLNLAHLYLGENLNSEALAVLNLIKQSDPDFYVSYQLAALHGAANFMMERYNTAAADFNDPSLEGEEEIEFWKNTTALMQGVTTKSIAFSTFEKQYVRNYPPDMRRRLTIIAADQMLTKKRYNTALRFLNQLADAKLLGPVKEYADILIGRIYFDMNKYDLSRKMLEPLVENSKKRFIRSSAQFYLASIDFQEGKIERKELIRRLDRLRMVWRGDSLEPTVLTALGDLYVEEGDYISALRSWRDLTRSYPENPDTQNILAKMSQTFTDLFNKGKADALPPIEALAIYYEFRDLTPVDSTGDRMIQNLADRLASVDLLDRAAALLEHQVTYRLQKEDRSRVGARLAMIYLLNKQPQMAVDALERTGYGNNPILLERQRNQIAAMAYSELSDGQTALALLRSDKSTDAKDIRMDVYWNGKDWQNVIATGENILASRSDITAPLSLHETQTLLRLAIAYSYTRDTLQLQYLRDYFSPLINDPERKGIFTFLTSNLEPLDNRNIMQLSQQLSNMQNFIQNYQTRVSEQGLSKAVN